MRRSRHFRRAFSIFICVSLFALLVSWIFLSTPEPMLTVSFSFPRSLGNVSRRHLCYVGRPHRTFSTPRDLIVTSIFQRHPNVALTLLSIRSTGCMARVLLMAEAEHPFDAPFLRLCSDLDVQVAFFDYTPGFHTDIYRSEWLLGWLSPRVSEFDRVFYIDAFDAFFQMDPFEHLVVKGMMTFVTEGVTIGNQPGNFEMIETCFGKPVAVALSDRELICSGSLAGDPISYVKYLKILTENLTRWHSCETDQQQINVLVWSGELEKVGVGFRTEGCNGTVNSMYYCPRYKIDIGGGFFDLSENSMFVNNAVMHHYKGWPSVVKNYYERCGMKRPKRWT
jgi:hypothetical protein